MGGTSDRKWDLLLQGGTHGVNTLDLALLFPSTLSSQLPIDQTHPEARGQGAPHCQSWATGKGRRGLKDQMT